MRIVKMFGIFFLTLSILITVFQINRAVSQYKLKKYSSVVEGTIDSVYSNLNKVNHWRWSEVYMIISYQYSPDSIAFTKEWCRYHSLAENRHLSCGEPGEKRKVRFVTAPNKSKVKNPDFVEVTDKGEFTQPIFLVSQVFMPLILMILGLVLFIVGKSKLKII